MTMLSIPIPESVTEDIGTLFRKLYRDALDQARRDASVLKDYLTLDEVVETYIDISKSTLEKWIKEKGLPLYKIDGKQFVKKVELYAFIDKHQV